MAKPNATIAEAYADRKAKIFLTTPIGVASYPHLLKHDPWQLEENGVYQCNTSLRLDADDPFVATLTELADEMFEVGKAELEEAVATSKGKELKKAKENLAGLKVFYPYEEDVDEEGEPNGQVIVKMKTTVRGTNKDTGDTWEKEVAIFDSQNQPVKGKQRSEMKLWAGSRIRVSVQVVPFCAAGLQKSGISLRISAVQVIELSGGGASAETYGFGVEEDGYEAETFDEGDTASTSQESSAPSEPEDDDDF